MLKTSISSSILHANPQTIMSGLFRTSGKSLNERKPISSSHEWLIFAVRVLSRLLVCKGNGQEAVWSKCNEPIWWKQKVAHPWKNPTENPKDSNEILIAKYRALKQGLLAEKKRLPPDIEDEMNLWDNGQYERLYFLTCIKSWLSKAANLKTELDAVKQAKSKNLAEPENQLLLNKIKEMLTQTAKCIDDMRNDKTNDKGNQSQMQNNSPSSNGTSHGNSRPTTEADSEEVAHLQLNAVDQILDNDDSSLGKSKHIQKNRILENAISSAGQGRRVAERKRKHQETSMNFTFLSCGQPLQSNGKICSQSFPPCKVTVTTKCQGNQRAMYPIETSIPPCQVGVITQGQGNQHAIYPIETSVTPCQLAVTTQGQGNQNVQPQIKSTDVSSRHPNSNIPTDMPISTPQCFSIADNRFYKSPKLAASTVTPSTSLGCPSLSSTAHNSRELESQQENDILPAHISPDDNQDDVIPEDLETQLNYNYDQNELIQLFADPSLFFNPSFFTY